MTNDERARFGFLGKPPPEIVNAPIAITRRWLALSEKAKAVAKISLKQSRQAEWEAKAKEIEHEYQDLVAEARKHTSR